MNALRLLRIWLLAFVVVLVGCGGRDETEPDDLGDAAADARRSDVASDRASDAPADRRDATGDVRTDGRADATTDPRTDPFVDTRVDTRIDARVDVRIDTVDVRTDPFVDRRVDTIDVRTDPIADTRVDADARVDAPRDADAGLDAAVDARNDGDAGCVSDNQCGAMTPHCNTTTGVCVARVAIAVTPANRSIADGTTQQFVATMTYSDTSTGDVTAQATWLSSNTTVATMSTTTAGLATGVSPGVTTISATFAGLAGGTQLTVTPATLTSIQVTPANASNALGTTRQFAATGTYSDNSTQDLTATATWASSDTNIATIAAGGLATAVGVGTTMISATVGTVSAIVAFHVNAAALVSINVTPANPTIATLTDQAFTATGTYTDNTTQDLSGQATWASSDPSVATLDGTVATGIAAGTTTISASFGGVTGSTQLTVTGASLTGIVITPSNPTTALGFDVQFTATGQFSDGSTQNVTAIAFWSSGTDAVASISNAGGSEGLATPLTTGTSTITATVAGISGSTVLTVNAANLQSITVSPASASIALGTNQAFTASGQYDDGTVRDITAQVSWGSSNIGVATISNQAGTKGRASSVSVGATTITAFFGGVSGIATLNVTPATLTAITVTPASGTTPLGTSLQFTATGTYSDSTTQDITALVTWTSSDVGVATISSAAGSEGLATPVAAGMTTITATLNAVAGSATLEVTP